MFGLRIRQNYRREQTFADHPDFPKVCDPLHQKCFANSHNSLPSFHLPLSSSTVLRESCYKRGLDANKLWEGEREMRHFRDSLRSCWDQALPPENSVATGLSLLLVYVTCVEKEPRPSCCCFGLSLYVVFMWDVDSLIVWSCSKICLELLKSMNSVLSSV